ncbi:MAG TPA: efflux RND transporter periplasmic adaptor subunit [Blastocatellia bacterium]|nr:efflux RND transporter periplasmic adaptor subunit [Blastocatellia bacterium]
MKTSKYIAIGLLTMTSVVAGCKVHSAENPPTPVKVKAVEMISSTGDLRYSASIIARTQVDLSFKVGGYVEAIHQVRGVDGRLRNVQEGDRIPQGTALARVRQSDYAVKVGQAESQASQVRSSLDSSRGQLVEAQSGIDSTKAQLAQAEASYAKASLDFDRAKNLFESQSLTKADYDAAKSQRDVTEAQLSAARSQVKVAEAKANVARSQIETVQAQIKGAQAAIDEARIPLQDTALRAPMNSVVLERKIEAGTLVSPGTLAFIIADTTSVKAIFGVPDLTVETLRLGSPITVTSQAALGKDFRGQITAISPSADAKSRVFEVEVTIPNPQNLLKVGMIVSLSLEETGAPVESPVVPLSAIVKSKDNPDNYAVFVIEEQSGKQSARIRNVKLGEAYGNTVAVIEGLKSGERVITTGATLLVDGQRVQIIP